MKIKYKVESLEKKRISEFLNISLLKVEELNFIDYYFFLREAFIYNCTQSEDGREYLRNAYRLEQTAPDREELRRNFKNKLQK